MEAYLSRHCWLGQRHGVWPGFAARRAVGAEPSLWLGVRGGNWLFDQGWKKKRRSERAGGKRRQFDSGRNGQDAVRGAHRPFFSQAQQTRGHPRVRGYGAGTE